jgi:hypothetical protein
MLVADGRRQASLALVLLPLVAVAACGASEARPEVNGALGRVDGVDVLWLWGAPDEMGYAEGALLCGRITRVVADGLLSNPLLSDYDAVVSLVQETAAVPLEREQQLRAMLAGMQERCPAAELEVDGAELPGGPRPITYEDLLLLNYVGVIQDLMACSSLTVWGEASATGATLHARNLDSAGGFDATKLAETMVKVYRRTLTPSGTWASVALPGRVGCISCFDDRGAGITNHNADRSALASTDTAGLAAIEDLSEQALLAVGSASDPVAAADAVYDGARRRGGNNLHLFLSCPGGVCPGAVVYEHDGNAAHPDGRATARRPGAVDDGLETGAATVCTNHFMERADPSTAAAGSLARYQILVDGVNAAVQTGGLDIAGALRLMTDVSAADLTAPTYYTTIVDTSSMTLYLHVAASIDDDAPLQPPHVLPLRDLFAALPAQ